MKRIEVQVQGGCISGIASADGAVRAFLGVPYARPPLGDSRWRPPQPVEPWQGVRRTDAFAPRCFQPSRPGNSISFMGNEPESEDCLYLNVWTAANTKDERRPVMVWFHGGAYYLGSGAVPLFHGEQLARKGVILVTLNYRLGRLGFLAHPELSKESGHRVSGNYGLLDQIAALRWVQDNIAAFGGDPCRVTAFGQSVGATSVNCMMISPLAKGLFHRGIGQSGAALGPVATSTNTGDSTQSLDHAEQGGFAFGRAMGATTAAQLRALPARELQMFGRDAGTKGVVDASFAPRGNFDNAYVVTDGYVMPEGGYECFAGGRQNDVPLLTGTNADEAATMRKVKSLQTHIEQSRAEFGDMADEFFRLYPAATDEEAKRAGQAAIGYRNFIWQNWAWARLHSQSGKSNTYYYRFTRRPPIAADARYLEQPARAFGAFHAAEIPYVFRNLGVRNWPWQALDRTLSDTMSSYWLNFAASGDPNGAGLPAWPVFDAQSPSTMCFGDSTAIGPVPDREKLEFWEAFYARERRRPNPA